MNSKTNIDPHYLVAQLDFNYYYTIYKNVIYMMHNRGYKALFKPKNRKEYVSMCLGYLAEMKTAHDFLDKLINVFEHKENNKKCMVYYHILNIKFKKADMDYILNYKQDSNYDKLILITKEKATSIVNSTAQMLQDEIQLFVENEFILNIIEHAFVPKHTRLNESEKKELMEYYNTDQKHFPAIYSDDPIVKYYDWKNGDMIKIERTGIDGIKEIYYRVVCERV